MLFKSNHVENVVERRRQVSSGSDEKDRPIEILDNGKAAVAVIKGQVIPQAKINNQPYKVIIKVDVSRTIIFASCECKAGKGGKCKHIIAVVYYVNSSESSDSKTCKIQEWGKPTVSQLEKYKKCATVNELVGSQEIPAVTKNQPTVPASVLSINCPLSIILRTTPNDEYEVSDVVEHLIKRCEEDCELDRAKAIATVTCSDMTMSDELNGNPITVEELAFYDRHVKVDPQEMFQILCGTRKQSKSSKWHEERLFRITASTKAHRIFRRKKDKESLIPQFLNSKVPNVAAVRYGNQCEGNARLQYSSITGLQVHTVGLVVKLSTPWLACSPDGIILFGDKLKLLEIKCPITCKDKPVISSNVSNLRYIRENSCKDGWLLSPSHMYYTQVQVSLFVIGATDCDFFVYSPKGSLLINVPRDETFIRKCIPSLETFYFEFYLPALAQMK